MRNFQGIICKWIRGCREIFKSALVYLWKTIFKYFNILDMISARRRLGNSKAWFSPQRWTPLLKFVTGDQVGENYQSFVAQKSSPAMSRVMNIKKVLIFLAPVYRPTTWVYFYVGGDVRIKYASSNFSLNIFIPCNTFFVSV